MWTKQDSHLTYSSLVWRPHLFKGVRLIERVLRSCTWSQIIKLEFFFHTLS